MMADALVDADLSSSKADKWGVMIYLCFGRVGFCETSPPTPSLVTQKRYLRMTAGETPRSRLAGSSLSPYNDAASLDLSAGKRLSIARSL